MQTDLFSHISYSLPLQSSFVKLERLAQEEIQHYKIAYSFQKTFFGNAIVGSTIKGICYLAFGEQQFLLRGLEKEFSNANFIHEEKEIHCRALNILKLDWTNLKPLPLHVKATNFQYVVWEQLLTIPFGNVTTYGELAREQGLTNGARAIGSAIGANPVAFIIPCHRVVQNKGGLGGFRWGLELKKKLLMWEYDKIQRNK